MTSGGQPPPTFPRSRLAAASTGLGRLRPVSLNSHAGPGPGQPAPTGASTGSTVPKPCSREPGTEEHGAGAQGYSTTNTATGPRAAAARRPDSPCLLRQAWEPTLVGNSCARTESGQGRPEGSWHDWVYTPVPPGTYRHGHSQEGRALLSPGLWPALTARPGGQFPPQGPTRSGRGKAAGRTPPCHIRTLHSSPGWVLCPHVPPMPHPEAAGRRRQAAPMAPVGVWEVGGSPRPRNLERKRLTNTRRAWAPQQPSPGGVSPPRMWPSRWGSVHVAPCPCPLAWP